jgi:hypothetical protein
MIGFDPCQFLVSRTGYFAYTGQDSRSGTGNPMQHLTGDREMKTNLIAVLLLLGLMGLTGVASASEQETSTQTGSETICTGEDGPCV